MCLAMVAVIPAATRGAGARAAAAAALEAHPAAPLAAGALAFPDILNAQETSPRAWM